MIIIEINNPEIFYSQLLKKNIDKQFFKLKKPIGK